MMKKTLIMFLILFANFVSAKKTIFLDVDETMCWSTADELVATKIQQYYPQLICISGLRSHEGWFYFFIPYIKEFIDFLIENDCEVHFFSAGEKARNEELIPLFLSRVYKFVEFLELQAAGHFKIFSRNDLVTPLRASATDLAKAKRNKNKLVVAALAPKLERKAKSLRAIFPDRDIEEMLLIDDYYKNSLFYKIKYENKKMKLILDNAEKPQLIGVNEDNFLNLLVSGYLKTDINFTYNNIPYFTGVIKTAFEFMQADAKKTFRKAVAEAIFCEEGDANRKVKISHEDFMAKGKRVFQLQQGTESTISDADILRLTCVAPVAPPRKDSLKAKNNNDVE